MVEDFLQVLPTAAVRELSLRADDHVFRQDRPCHGFYYLRSGEVVLQRVTQAGAIVTVHRARPRNFFAEASLFSELYHCNAVCQRDSRLYQMDKQATLEALQNNPEFALRLSATLARQVQSNRQLLEILAIKKAEERVFAALGAGLFTGTVVQLATEIGLTHEATYRALADLLKARRVVKTGRGKYNLAAH